MGLARPEVGVMGCLGDAMVHHPVQDSWRTMILAEVGPVVVQFRKSKDIRLYVLKEVT